MKMLFLFGEKNLDLGDDALVPTYIRLKTEQSKSPKQNARHKNVSFAKLIRESEDRFHLPF